MIQFIKKYIVECILMFAIMICSIYIFIYDDIITKDNIAIKHISVSHSIHDISYNLCSTLPQWSIDYSTKSDFKSCIINKQKASGECDGGKWSQCNGNCENSIICGGNSNGCNGNCINTFNYDSTCSDKCNGSTFFIINEDPNKVCSGACDDISLILPYNKYINNFPKICDRTDVTCILYNDRK